MGRQRDDRDTHDDTRASINECDASLSWQATILLCVGYGLFLISYCGAIPYIALSVELVNGWEWVLLAQFALFAATGIGCPVVRLLVKSGHLQNPALACVLSTVVMVICLVAAYLVARPKAPGIVVAGCMFISGLASSYPLSFWHNTIRVVYSVAGQVRSLVALVGTVCASGVISLLVTPWETSRASLLATAIGISVGSALCLIALARAPIFSRDLVDGARIAQEDYHLTAYSASIVISLGITMGLAGGTLVFSTDVAQTSGILYWAMTIGKNVLYLLLLVWVLRGLRERHVWFGLLTRLSIAIIGLVLSLLPVMYTVIPNVAHVPVRILFALQVVVIVLFSTEIACSNGLCSLTVSSTNYALYALAACVGALAFWACQTLVGGHLAWDLVGLLAVIATVVVMPLLPSASSNAAAFALDKLPENEGHEGRLARVRDEIAATGGLTERETEVLGLLLRGMSRQQIAGALSLSEWTVKDYISTIYGKAGVHSYQELMALARRNERAE